MIFLPWPLPGRVATSSRYPSTYQGDAPLLRSFGTPHEGGFAATASWQKANFSCEGCPCLWPFIVEGNQL